MAVKTKKISTLIESQLPSFISSEYELFTKFVQKYYEQQESQGQPLDIALNLDKYASIDFYEKNLLQQSTTLVNSVSASDTSILLDNADGFPEKNGYLQIDDEIIFYAERTGNLLTDCSRGISGNTQLGDIYEKSVFISTDSATHLSGSIVSNISNLFLYGLIKSFESQYLGAFPEKYLKGEVDKRTLIKNIKKFYKSKGTDSSIRFIFNTLVSEEKPTVYKPRDFTYKTSESDWISIYALKVKVISGNPKLLIGEPIVQLPTEEYGYASATVDNVFVDGTSDGEQIWNIVLAPETVNGLFSVSTKTRLEKDLQSSSGANKRVNVFSTLGWNPIGEILINNEVIKFSSKTATQFIIESRGSTPVFHPKDATVYKPVILEGSGIKLLSLGIVYNLIPQDTQPYSFIGDEIQISNPGFETTDPKIVKSGTNQVRWILNQGSPVNIPTIPSIQNSLSEVATDVAAIFEDDQYYYVASSSYPSYKILDGSIVNEELLDQKQLRILRKNSTRTTEVYKTPKRDVGILLNGVPIFGYKDEESIRFGILEEIKVDTQGTGYEKPPFVLLDGVPNQAKSVLSGQVVEKIIVNTNTVFPRTPEVVITSGRDAVVRAVVTKGKVTSLIIDNPGEYYSSPPLIRIRDNAGKGRFADFTAVVNTDGKITGFVKIEEGNFYNQDTVIVDVIPVGRGAAGIPYLKEWNKNRFVKYSSKLDTEYGYIFENYNNVLEYGYAHVGNPKALRVILSDNIDLAGSEPSTKTHSPIIGFAYDGNPIYGPFGHQDPLNPQSPIVRMTSSYSLNGNRPQGPALSAYPIGSFVNDYRYVHKSGSLDENNGRFCITPDYPQGTYAYFLTINSNQIPQFPYFVGENFYSLPVDSNYNSNINQADIPKKSKRLFTQGMPKNGEGVIAQIAEVKSGTVDSINLLNSSSNFSINSKVYFDNSGTEGKEAEAIVSSVEGKPVNYLYSKENKVVQLTVVQNAYLFANDTLTQPASGAYGEIIGTVANDNLIVLKNVIGTFNSTGTFSATIKTFSILIDQDSSYTQGAILSLTDGINLPIATAEVLEGTSRQNIVKIKVLTGTWVVNDNYFIQSNDLFNTSGSRIVTLTSLSDGLIPFDVNQSVALVETSVNHGLGIEDEVKIDILPNDTTKTKTYYLRKRLYQLAKFKAPTYQSSINYTGIGRFEILNGGAFYAPGTYTNISLTGGSGTGAKATIIVSSAGVVSSVVLQNGGSGYKKADYLGVSDQSLSRSNTATSGSSRLTLYVDHSGFSIGSTKLVVDSTIGVSNGDLLKVGKEIVKVASISENTITVIRAQDGTLEGDHFDGEIVSLYKPRYNFVNNFSISTSSFSGRIKTYNPETQEVIVIFDYAAEKNNAERVEISTSFFDSSTPKKLVAVESVEDVDYKFEFSEDNTNFVPNPNINIQEFYKYKFDTSHSSLTGTYFDISPSKNYNIITEEKTATTILPGNTGSFTTVKFGFGSALSANNYSSKKGTQFANFYYFDRNSIVNSDDKYLKIITDPLQGTKKITYVTPNRFVYQLDSTPLWDGSGSITYKTNGEFAIGKIDEFKMINLGLNYKKVPIIVGCDPTKDYRAKATVLFDSEINSITEVRIDNVGSNYTNPKIIITKGDGVGARFNIVVRSGKIFSITIDNPGRGYTFAPEISIIEGSVEAYVESKSIGVPQSVTIIKNGGAFHLDKTISSSFTSKYIFALINISGNYQKGEVVVQKINGTEVAKAIVSEWRSGSNLLKLEKISGIFRQGYPIQSILTSATGIVKSVFVSTFKDEIISFYDNLGYYSSDKGRLGVSNQKILDSYFYQDYSYVIESQTPIQKWRDLIKSTTHPAGFKLFGQVDIESTAQSKMPTQSHKNTHFSVIQLWDPNKNKITVENTKRTITQIVQKVENQRARKGVGSAAQSEFNFSEYRAFEVILSAPFDGYYDTDGRLQGNKVFQLRNRNTNLPFTPLTARNLIITLDGVLQEPGVAYTVQNDTIVFSNPPLGDGSALTGNTSNNVTTYKGVTFYGKYFAFKDNQYNNRYLRKIRNIFQRNGRWLDAANQLERNRKFIIQETVGYGKAKHPTLDWSTKLGDYQRDIGYILDAYEHDLRFGGNVKTVDYIKSFLQDTEYDYITKNKVKSSDIFKYATKLAGLSIRNWDVVENGVNYIQGTNKIIVQNTDRLAIGMYVSSGKAFPLNTRIISIDSSTEVTVSNLAQSNSGSGVGGAPAGPTYLSGTTGNQNVFVQSNTGIVLPGNQYSVVPGFNLSVPPSFSSSDQATFYLSAINTGTFYDASNLILKNKAFLQEQISGYIYDAYNLPPTGRTKCQRDLGILIDAVVYHLRFGGNEKIVDFGQSYYIFYKYPYGEKLTHINTNPVETAAALDAWNSLRDYMILAMRNQLSIANIIDPLYGSALPFSDPSVLSDAANPTCQEVASSINTMISIVKDILAKGAGIVEKTKINTNKSGYWTDTTTYSNYNIIDDPLIPAQECDDVISSVNSLYGNLKDILDKKSVTRTLPDYIDGENKIFELYWENGDDVITDEDEDLFLTINAVLQRPKYTETYPLFDSYYIDRTVIPNKLVFDVAPIWDQDFGAKTIGEPTAVEKVSGVGVGNYKRLTIDYNLVDNVRSGPFLILDVEDYTVQNIEEPDFLYVFLDGVLQRKGYSYTVSGPNISFNVPILKEMKIDMRYLYGRDIGQVLNVFDFAPDSYYSKSKVSLTVTSGLDNLLSKSWMGDKIGSAIQAYQMNTNGTYNVIGEIENLYSPNSNTLEFDVFGHAYQIDNTKNIIFAVRSFYSKNTSIAISNSVVTFEKDDDGRLILSTLDQLWAGTSVSKTYRKPFVSLSNNDLVKLEGQDKFRKIKKLPGLTTSKEHRNNNQVSNSMFGTVDIETYNGISRGEGLSVVATIQNGKVISLTWNQRSYNPITQPTAYQYETPPVLHFVPVNGNGGGARANVLVSKGQVISVDLLDGGSGYTEAPKVVVARRFDVLNERDIGVSLINIGINPYVETAGMTVISRVDVLGNQVSGVNSFTSIFFDSPVSSDRFITAEIQLVRDSGKNLKKAAIQFENTTHPNADDVVLIDLFHEATQVVSVISGRVADIISTSIVTTNRQITTTFENLIPNDALSNVNYYATGAYLDVDLSATGNIVYVADTSKFKSNGYLLVGDEIVRYYRKLTDRFLKVERAQFNTTAKPWLAGTFLRQVPDPISTAFGGIALIESQSQLVTVKGGLGTANQAILSSQKQFITPPATIVSTRKFVELVISPAVAVTSISNIIAKSFTKFEPPANTVQSTFTGSVSIQDTITIQSVITDVSVSKEALEFLLIPPPSGAIDGYEESAFISDPIFTRLNGFVDIADVNGVYTVTTRNLTNIIVRNALFGNIEYVGNYAKTNAGHRISHFSGIFDDGTAGVSGLTIQEMDTYFPSLTLQDFTLRGNSSYTLAGDYFNLLPPSIQNPVTTISQNPGTIGATISVRRTTHFPTSGYLFTGNGGVVQYTGKTSTTFTGCSVVKGSNSISVGTEIIPHQIT